MIDVAPGNLPEPSAGNVLEMGSTSDKLRAMQGLINAPQTGRFDEATSNALRAFQQGMGLEATGFPNQETLTALKQMVGGSMLDLTWFDWAIIYAFEYKWAVIGVGIGAVGGIGYWLWRRSKRRA